MADERERHRWLVEGLLGERHGHLWHTSAEFRAAVEQLARMLPLFVDGLAAHATRVRVEQRAEMERLALQPAALTPRMNPADVEKLLSGLYPWLGTVEEERRG